MARGHYGTRTLWHEDTMAQCHSLFILTLSFRMEGVKRSGRVRFKKEIYVLD